MDTSADRMRRRLGVFTMKVMPTNLVRKRYSNASLMYLLYLSIFVSVFATLFSSHSRLRLREPFPLKQHNTFVGGESEGKSVLNANLSMESAARDDGATNDIPSYRPHIGIKIIANNRVRPLERLLLSLLNAHYNGASVPLEFYLEAGQSPEMLHLVLHFDWPHGPKQVHLRHTKGGLINAVLESWYPASPEELYIILEDDIEVSPYFYVWAERAYLAYKRDSDEGRHLAGISLYTPRLGELKWPRPRYSFYESLRRGESPGLGAFRFQLPCSWGTMYFPWFWAELRAYAAKRYVDGNEQGKFVIPGSRSTGWSASWKKFAIELFWSKGYYLLYPNLFNETSFSTNHLEAGEHIGQSTTKHLPEDFTVPLVYSRELIEGALAWTSDSRLSDLPLLNVFGVPISSWLRVWNNHVLSVVPDNATRTKLCTSKMLATPCSQYNQDIRQLFFTTEKFTVVISYFWTMERRELLDSLVQMYASIPLVDKIFLVWHNHRVDCPDSAIVNGVFVHFACQPCDSLNNRFLLDMRITTQAVLIVDDDIQVHPSDLENLFHSWKFHQERIVGFFPRWFQPVNDTTGQYGLKPHMVQHQLGYSFMLTKIMMVHSQYLFEYRCGLGARAHKQVDEYTNGEDLAFSIMVSKIIGRVAALFMKPKWPVIDYGTHSKEGIHKRVKQHAHARNAMVQASISMINISAWDLCCEDHVLEFSKALGKPMWHRIEHFGITPFVFNPCKHATNVSTCKTFIPYSSLQPVSLTNSSLLAT